MPSITDWLMVAITAVYVVATIFICWANIRSAKTTREQVAESKRQFDEENRAYITYAFIYEKKAFYGLRFTNHGKRVAKKVKISFSTDFIQSLDEPKFADWLSKTTMNECILGVDQSIDIYFGGNEFSANMNKLPIEGKIIYEDDLGKYVEPFMIDFNNYPPIFTVDSELEDIRKEMKKQTQELQKLHKAITALQKNAEQENK